MSDKIAKLLEQLAAQLGTTTEYLWGVLLQQAPVSATVDVFIYLGYVAFVVVSVVMTKRFVVWLWYGDADEDVKIPIGILGGVFGFLFWIGVLSVGSGLAFNVATTAAGFVNPEYWALQEVLAAVRR